MVGSPRRKVLVHRSRQTVHELAGDGYTLCGNGWTNPRSYIRMRAAHAAGKPACLSCAWIAALPGQRRAAQKKALRGFKP